MHKIFLKTPQFLFPSLSGKLVCHSQDKADLPVLTLLGPGQRLPGLAGCSVKFTKWETWSVHRLYFWHEETPLSTQTAGGCNAPSSVEIQHETEMLWCLFLLNFQRLEKGSYFLVSARIFFWEHKVPKEKLSVFWEEFILSTWLLLWTEICGCFIN